MKVCKYCHEERPDEAFEVCRVVKGKSYRRLKCKKCKRAGANLRRARLRAWLIDYKKMLVCVHCGFADFRALEFHHKNHSDKDFNVSDMIRAGASIQTLRHEINKCIVLCSNCHQIAHYDGRN